MKRLFSFSRKKRVALVPETVADAPYPTVELFHWKPKNGNRNFGDHLSKVIVETAARAGNATLDDEVQTSKRLLAIGSIIHFAQDGDIIWGTGINGKIPLEQITARTLDIRAVRGPKTAAILRNMGFNVPNIFGDPALLAPHLLSSRFKIDPTEDYIVIPNLNDLTLIRESERNVSPLCGWNRVIERIVRSKFVVASSLHGIILAEAFGVPARYVRFSENESQFKYDDYAQGTGRPELVAASSIEHALDMGGHPSIDFDKQALLAAFPYDLWNSAGSPATQHSS